MTPTARPPSLAWRLKFARLVLARLLERAEQSAGLRIGGSLGTLAAAAWWVFVRDAPAPVPGQPAQAWVQVVWQIVIMVVAMLVAYAMRPKQKPPEAAKPNIPQVEDGASIERIYGDVWVDDSVVLGFKQLGTRPIKTKGGKK